MSSYIVECCNSECGQSFQVNEFALALPPSVLPERIGCPHCGATADEHPGSVFITHTLVPVGSGMQSHSKKDLGIPEHG